MPYLDDQFNLLWNANVTQYLTDDELTAIMREACRVNRPGGFVATKEFDMTSSRLWALLDPVLLWHFIEATKDISQTAGTLRTTDLYRWYMAAGLEIFSIKTIVGERWQPIDSTEKAFLNDILPIFGNMAIAAGLPESELKHWRRLIDQEAPDYLLKDPEFYWRGSNVLVVGRVPD